jgi:hypothetical protein
MRYGKDTHDWMLAIAQDHKHDRARAIFRALFATLAGFGPPADLDV